LSRNIEVRNGLGQYAQALGIAELCIEPALAEVMTPDLGGKGLCGAPSWSPGELCDHTLTVHPFRSLAREWG
jgi:hypothetical protein